MTLPDERYRAVNNVREFLRDLLDPKKTPKVPKWIRKEAYYRLKHYPSSWDIDRAKTRYDEVFEPTKKEPYED